MLPKEVTLQVLFKNYNKSCVILILSVDNLNSEKKKK